MSKILSPVLGIFGMIASFVPGGQPVALALTAARIGVDFVAGQKKRKGTQEVSIQTPPPLNYVTVEHPIVPRIISYGRVQNPGVFFWKEAGQGKISLTYGLYMCEGPISALESITCDDELVDWLDQSANLSPVPGKKIYGPSSNSIKWVQWAAGPVMGPLVFVEVCNATSEAGEQSYLLSQFQPGGTYFGVVCSDGTMLNFWDSRHLAKGCTCFYTWAYFPSNTTYNGGERQKFYPNNWPTYNFVYRGAPVYDPRDLGQTATVNGTYSLYNSTWTWTENPALIAADYVNRLIQNNQLAVRGINWASIAEAANDCDRLVPCYMRSLNNPQPTPLAVGGVSGGICYEPFARMTANVTMDLEPRDVLAKIMAVCDGSYGLDKDGLFCVWIGKWEDPNITFTDSDISAIQEDFGLPISDETNYFTITYTEPRQRYSPFHAPIYQDTESIARLGRRTEDIQLDYCPSPTQAWRMVRRYAKRRNSRRRLTVRLTARGILAAGQRYIGIDSDMLNVTGTFRVLTIAQGDSLAEWNLELVEVFHDIYDDVIPPPDPLKSFEVVKPPTIPTPSPVLSIAYDTTNNGYVVRADNSGRYSLGFFITSFVYLISDPNYQWDMRYSTDGGTTWTQANTFISQYTAQTPVLPSGTTVAVQSRWIQNNGAVGSWSGSVSITIP